MYVNTTERSICVVSAEERQSICIASGRPDPPKEMTNANAEDRHKPMALEVWGTQETASGLIRARCGALHVP